MLCSACFACASGARAASITGIADENANTWSAPDWAAFAATGVKQLRHQVPWNIFENASEVTKLKEWLAVAESHGAEVMIAFRHSAGAYPAAATYLNAVDRFRQDFPNIQYFSAWNEPNHNPKEASGSSPYNAPEVAAGYWVNMNFVCHLAEFTHSCTVVGGDFLDQSGLKSYMERYEAALAESHVSPAKWSIHPYGAVEKGNWAAGSVIHDEFMPLTEGKPIWLTEVGGMVCKTDTGLVGGSYKAAEAAQNTSAKNLLALIGYEGGRVERTYYYTLAGGGSTCPASGSGGTWDSALLTAAQTPRPAYVTLFPNALNPTSGSSWTVRDAIHGEQSIYYVNSSGSISEWIWTGERWINTAPIGGSVRTGTNPAVVRDPISGEQFVYYVDAEGGISLLRWSGKEPWEAERVGGSVAAGTSPTVVRNAATGEQSIYYVNTGGSVTELWGSGRPPWGSATIGGSVRTGASPTAILDPITGDQDVYYPNSEGGMSQLVWMPPEWKSYNLGGSPQAATAPTVIRDPASGEQSLYYSSTDGSVHELIWTGKLPWIDARIGGSVRSGTSPTAVRDPISTDQDVYYVNGEGKISQLLWMPPEWKSYSLPGSSV